MEMGLDPNDDVGVDLALQTRLGLLRRSLLIVEAAIESIDSARRSNAGAGVQTESLSKLNESLNAATTALGSIIGHADPAVSGAVLGALTSLNAARAALSGAETTAAGPSLFSLQQTSLDTDLKGGVKERLRELASIETNLGLAQGKDEETHHQLLGEAWAQYAELYGQCCETVFSEYVDLIRGVLIRDAGLDQYLCRIADDLGRRWGRFKGYEWHSLTIPASRDWRGMSAAHLIRIGFPEWSVWSIALTAHEFGHVFAAEFEPMRKLVAETAAKCAVSTEEAQDWVADVFATSIMGPAYAWAAILLRADPASAPDDARVTVMLKTLARIGLRTGTQAEEQERIKRIWEQSRKRAREVAPRRDELGEVFDEVIDAAYSRVLAPFRAADWDAAREKLVAQLESPELEPERIADGLHGNELRTILVAAWEARIRLHDEFAKQRAELGEDDEAWREALLDQEREALLTLADRTRDVCMALIDRQVTDGRPGQGLTFEQPAEPSAKPDQPLGVGVAP
jgi:hypothetical protein